MKKLLLILSILIKFSHANSQEAQAKIIDSIINNYSGTKLVLFDTGTFKREGLRRHPFVIKYTFDSLTHALVSIISMRDSTNSRQYIEFFYKDNQLIKIEYNEMQMDDLGFGEFFHYYYYLHNDKLIESFTIISHPPKAFIPLSITHMIAKSKIYQDKFKSLYLTYQLKNKVPL